MSTINLVTRSKRKLCHKLYAASIWLVLPAFRQSQQHPVQSHQTLLPSSPPPAPPTNRRGKGLGHARLYMEHGTVVPSKFSAYLFSIACCTSSVGAPNERRRRWYSHVVAYSPLTASGARVPKPAGCRANATRYWIFVPLGEEWATSTFDSDLPREAGTESIQISTPQSPGHPTRLLSPRIELPQQNGLQTSPPQHQPNGALNTSQKPSPVVDLLSPQSTSTPQLHRLSEQHEASSWEVLHHSSSTSTQLSMIQDSSSSYFFVPLCECLQEAFKTSAFLPMTTGSHCETSSLICSSQTCLQSQSSAIQWAPTTTSCCHWRRIFPERVHRPGMSVVCS